MNPLLIDAQMTPEEMAKHEELCQTVDSRIDELRLLGNGVDPDVAAKAFVTLYGRLMGGMPTVVGA